MGIEAGWRAFCRSSVQKLDHPHYLVSLFVPGAVRDAYLALRALNIELASVQDRVSDSTLASMRLTWWRDSVKSVYAGNAVQGNPVMDGVAALRDAGVSRHWLLRLVDARLNLLTAPGSASGSVSELENYAEDTASVMMYAQLQMLGVQDIHADHAASHVGKAVGLATLLRGARVHARHRRMIVPVDVAVQHGVVSEEVFRLETSPAFADAVYDVACVAHTHVAAARDLAADVPRNALPALRTAAVADHVLTRLQKLAFDALDPQFSAPRPLSLQFALFRHYLAGSF